MYKTLNTLFFLSFCTLRKVYTFIKSYIINTWHAYTFSVCVHGVHNHSYIHATYKYIYENTRMYKNTYIYTYIDAYIKKIHTPSRLE